ncbi:hypothetical protein SP15_057 [Bacillus phage SP-15]|uniref:Uncharacterized protein n=1 Tax=Bacillus phage SP-15 TaxID=1792032 RepID=A0A127AW07_9CAUD|nr:hypothetical protein SP15_057 [Bacillus phage SP-15]AMM44856.1 hypothetical protein SP15_057 [Bacillus phage SP-15]
MSKEKIVAYSGTKIEKFDSKMKLVDVHQSQSVESANQASPTATKPSSNGNK